MDKLTDEQALDLAQYIDSVLGLYAATHEDTLNDIYHAIRQWQGDEPRIKTS